MKKFLFLAAVVLTAQGFAQVTLTGVVRDTLNAPLELANIIALDQNTNTMASYGITNDSGAFKIELGKNGRFEIQVSYVGMKLAVADDLETGTAVTVQVLGEDIPAIVHWCKDARVGLHLLGRLERDTLVAIETAHDEFAEFR